MILRIKHRLVLIVVISFGFLINTAYTHAENEQETQTNYEILMIEEAFTDASLLAAVKEEIAALGYHELSYEALATITELVSVRNQGISSLAGIELLTNLQALEMRSNQIDDLTPLSALTQLESIDLRENSLVTLVGIENLINLKILDVRVNAIESLTPLGQLLNLEQLDIRDNRVTDITALEDLSQLTEFSARNNGIVDVAPLANATEMVELNLHSNQVADISALSSLTKMERLVLRRNNITDISALQYMSRLEDLNIRDNAITDIRPLENLARLRIRLNLDGNTGITDFTPIAHYYHEIEDVDFVLPGRPPINLDDLNPVIGEARLASIRTDVLAANAHITDRNIRATKLEQLATGPFAFYRGTASLFFRDINNNVIEFPESWNALNQFNTWITGDLHIENIGFYGNRFGEAIFELNDFDEVGIAPFYYDLVKFGTSLYLLNDAAPRLQLEETTIMNSVNHYASAYQAAVQRVADGEINVEEHYFTQDNLTGFIGEFAKSVSGEPLNNQLTTWTTIGNGRQFDITNNRLALATETEKQNIIDNWSTYIAGIDQNIKDEVGQDYFEIKDIARRINAGLGSLGYDRFYILIEGETSSLEDDIILDVKAQGPSAVEASGLFNGSEYGAHANRTIAGTFALHNFADIHWGTLEVNDQSFLVKERSPFKDEVGPTDFAGVADLDNFIQASAEATAYAHIRAARQLGVNDYVNNLATVFTNYGDDFAEEFTEVSLRYYAQVLSDQQLYRELYADGAFEQDEEENGAPTDPVDSEDPIDLEDPVDSEEPIDEEDSIDPADPVDIEDSVDPSEGTIEDLRNESESSGEALPATATTQFNYLILGLVLLLSGGGVFTYYRLRTNQS
ncbi:Uncharacterized conserved protein, DUF2252 family [Amphibacillus marinus]|uniref:Uncharacterized conserved protein, DUF2252 family n=1 Tax=Amphibacillus marinus TaxID=872970 RepID=A0A1H8M4C6_9BACI|nr:DUF2252 family protein [Amphibacillus marinus]SEO12214.1 Uncharacterized conserved protein, DUF2252 family [Amphibacillus marinus]